MPASEVQPEFTWFGGSEPEHGETDKDHDDELKSEHNRRECALC